MSPLKFCGLSQIAKNLPAVLFISTKLFQAQFLLRLSKFCMIPYANVIFITGISAPMKQSTFIKSGFHTKVAFFFKVAFRLIPSKYFLYIPINLILRLNGSVTEVNQIIRYTLRQSKFNPPPVKMDLDVCGFCETCNLLCLIWSLEGVEVVHAQTH